MVKNKDLIFICSKCGHHLFVINGKDWIKKLKKLNCPNCGEEPEENWIFEGLGNYKTANDFKKLN